MNAAITPSAFTFAAPEELRVNLLTLALGVPRESLCFSWAMRSGDVGDIQTCYRIVLAARLEDMHNGDYLLDTGWTVSDECSCVSIAGLSTLLQDNELYYWAVQLRNKSGAESAMSEPMPFTTALHNEWEDTHGIWCPMAADRDRAGDFCFLRTEFRLPDADEVEYAVLSVTATSPEPSRRFVFNAYLNGSFVGLGPSRIGKGTQGDRLLYYHGFDVTSLLGTANALSAVCYTKEDKRFLCQLTAFYRNGTRRVLVNSARDVESFFALDGGSVFASGTESGTAFFTEEAENINATTFPFGFDRPGFAVAWPQAVLREDLETETQTLTPYPGEPVGRYVHDVASVEHRKDGSVLIDLGQEIVGGLRLTLTSPDVHAVRLLFGEELDEEGNVRYHMRTGNLYREVWTLRRGEQTLENFGMKAFRYVQILDCHADVGEDDVKGVAIRRAFDPEEASFTCSNEVLCRLYDTFKYAVCATRQHLFVNSQSRERTPYEGDTLINMLAAYAYTGDLSLARHTVDYLISHRTRPAEYALLAVRLVRLDYLYSGDRTLLEKSYGALRRRIVGEKVDELLGLVPVTTAAEDGWNTAMVDCPPVSRDGFPVAEARFNTVYNAIYYVALRDMTVMADVLGKEEDATAYRITADNLRAAMLERLYSPEHGAFRDGLREDGTPIEHYSQHATVYALCMGIYASEQMRDTLGRTLVGQDEIKTSIYGAFYLFDALYRAGFGAYATALLASDDVTPGAHTFAAALASADVTVAPEAWCVAEAPDMTLSHLWGASPAALIVQGMFGIRPTRPGFHKFEIRPQIGSLPYAAIRVPTVKGTIAVSLGQNREAYEAEVVIPPNAKATVLLPVLPGGTGALFVNNQIANFPVEKGCYRIELGSGTHRLLAQ